MVRSTPPKATSPFNLFLGRLERHDPRISRTAQRQMLQLAQPQVQQQTQRQEGLAWRYALRQRRIARQLAQQRTERQRQVPRREVQQPPREQMLQRARQLAQERILQLEQQRVQQQVAEPDLPLALPENPLNRGEGRGPALDLPSFEQFQRSARANPFRSRVQQIQVALPGQPRVAEPDLPLALPENPLNRVEGRGPAAEPARIALGILNPPSFDQFQRSARANPFRRRIEQIQTDS